MEELDIVGAAKGLAAGTPIVGAATSFAGDLVSAYAAHREAVIQRDWSERMSNTAYQRQVADMRAAGLNPILAAVKGGGASTPSTSAPAVPQAIGTRAVSSALQAQLNASQVDLLRAQARQADSQDMKNLADAALSRAQLPGVVSSSAATAAKQSIAESIYSTKYGAFLQWLNATTEAIRGAGSSAKSVMPR